MYKAIVTLSIIGLHVLSLAAEPVKANTFKQIFVERLQARLSNDEAGYKALDDRFNELAQQARSEASALSGNCDKKGLSPKQQQACALIKEMLRDADYYQDMEDDFYITLKAHDSSNNEQRAKNIASQFREFKRRVVPGTGNSVAKNGLKPRLAPQERLGKYFK